MDLKVYMLRHPLAIPIFLNFIYSFNSFGFLIACRRSPRAELLSVMWSFWQVLLHLLRLVISRLISEDGRSDIKDFWSGTCLFVVVESIIVFVICFID